MATFCGQCGTAQGPGARSCATCGSPAPQRAEEPFVGSFADRSGSGTGLPDQVGGASPAAPAATGAGRVRGRRRTRTVVVAVAAALTVGVGGAAVYAATALGGGGSQPEDVLPASAFAFAKIDLDPSAGQKLAAYRLARQFPDSGVTSEDGLRDDLLRRLFPASGDIAYDTDVKPWLGQRAGVALLPPPVAGDAPTVLLAVQVSDRARAERGLTTIAARLDAEEEEPLRFAFPEDQEYVLLGDDQAAVDAAAGEDTHLADDDGVRRGVEALDGDQIGLAWTDLGALWRALPQDLRDEALREQPGLAPSGTVVVGARADDTGAEVVGRTLDLSAGDDPDVRALAANPLGSERSTGLVQELSADSISAFSVTRLGDGLSELYETFAVQVDGDQEVQAFVERFGVRLPHDLRAVLGTETAVGVAGDVVSGPPVVDVRVRTDDPERAVDLLTQAREAAAEETLSALALRIRPADGGFRLSLGAMSSARLGDDPDFRRAVPDAATSGITYYADLAALLEEPQLFAQELTPTARRNLEPLAALGASATLEDGGNSTFRLRVTIDE